VKKTREGKVPECRKLGFKAGLEIHQQLDCGKLFCRCPTNPLPTNAVPEVVTERRLRVSAGELGEVDVAALEAAGKKSTFSYDFFSQNCCLVELDEEPPMPEMNADALDIALEISLLLNCTPVDELHTMRKTVVDGSNTSGFQRTLLLATEGFVETSRGRVGITQVQLEEDASRILERKSGLVRYSLERLGLPLVEIVTDPDIMDFEHAKETAKKIGMICRSTGRVKRGIGSIRQDINVSIFGGARTEIKGAQELGLIPEIVGLEVERQKSLILIAGKAKKIVGPLWLETARASIVDVSELFTDSKCAFIKKGASGKDTVVLCAVMPGFSGMLKQKVTPTKTLGLELSGYAKAKAGVGGIIHSDEDLSKYPVTDSQADKVKKALKAGKGDLFVMVVAQKNSAKKALEAVIERAGTLSGRVPEETRNALADANTEYLRPLAGSARMYPETDVRLIEVTKEKVRQIKECLPEILEEKEKRYLKEFGLNRKVAGNLVGSTYWPLFEKMVSDTQANPLTIATVLTEDFKSLSREGVDLEQLDSVVLLEMFRFAASGKISNKSIPKLVSFMASNPGFSLEKAVEKLGLSAAGDELIKKIVKEVVSKNRPVVLEKGFRAISVVMGESMKALGGGADGKKVSRVVKLEIERLLSES